MDQSFEYKKLEHLCEQKMMNNVAMDIVDSGISGQLLRKLYAKKE
jgi:hypothetical protein